MPYRFCAEQLEASTFPHPELSCILTSQAECYTTSGSLPGPHGLSDHDLIFTV